MYVRVKRVGAKENPREYLQIVESFRDDRTVRQRVIATLGRLDHLRAEGAIDGLMRSLSMDHRGAAQTVQDPPGDCGGGAWDDKPKEP